MKKVVFLTLILSVISVLLFGGIGIAQAKFLPGVSDIFSWLANTVSNLIIEPLSNQLLQLIQSEPQSNFLTVPAPLSPTPSPTMTPSSQPAPTTPAVSQYIKIEPTPSNPKPEPPQAVTQPVSSIPPSYATLTDLTNLQTRLTSLITANQTQGSSNVNQMTYAFAPTQKIDNLGIVTISQATVSNDLTLGGNLSTAGNLSVSGTQSFIGTASFSGNVGIGTATPLSGLDVNGGVAIGSYAGLNAAPSNGLIVSGKVGIGTTTPDYLYKLDVNGTIGGNEIRFDPRKQQGLVTFIFDDSNVTDYTVMKPVFAAQGEVAVSSACNWLIENGGPNYLTYAQLQELQSAGWEIASHTRNHSDLTTLTEAQLRVQLGDSKRILESYGLVINNFVYPYGRSNETVRRLTREYYRSARGGDGINPYVLETYNLRSVEISDSTQLATYETYIDTATSDNKWMIFFTHQTDAAYAAMFNELIDYIQSKGLRIVTMNQALDLVGNMIDVGDNLGIGQKGIRANYIDGNVGIMNGNLGVGLTSPTVKLTVQGSANSTASVGSEKVGNNDFSTNPDTAWTWGANWTHDTTNFEADHATSTGGSAVVSIDYGGTGYTVNDVLTLSGGNSDGTLTVTTVSSGKITAVSITTAGTGYATGSGKTVTGGTGTAATFTIVRLADDSGTLSQNVSVTASHTYEVKFTIKNSTAGHLKFSLGGVTSSYLSGNQTAYTQLISTTGTGNLIFTPTINFNGSIDDVSVKEVTFATAVTTTLNSDGTIGYETRSGGSGYFNTFIGSYAGRASYYTTGGFAGKYNSAFGYSALFSNTTGYQNSAMGYQALYANTTGYGNSAMGYLSLFSNTTGLLNSAIGYQALYANTTGSFNSAMGYQSLVSNTTGSSNSAMGSYALYANTTGSTNSAFGMYSLSGNTTGSNNSTAGYLALQLNTTGGSNSAMGSSALRYNITGSYNSAMGSSALFSNTTGSYNSATGYQTLYSNTTGSSNSAMGGYALYYNTTGYNNSAMGYQALYLNTTGYNNSATGYGALYANTTGYNNIAMGVNALYLNTTGYANSAMGNYALYSNTTGYNNTANGYNSLYYLKPQSKAITGFADYSGTVAGTVLATSTAHGLSAGTTAGVGIYGTTNYNGTYTVTYIDANSFYFTDAWVANDATGWWGIDAQGKNNTALGYYAGYSDVTGSSNLFLGYYAGAYETGSNAFYINNVNESNTANDKAYSLLYGTFSGTAGSLTGQQLVINGKVGIGTTTPNWLLQISGTRPSLAFSDYSSAANSKHWLFSSMGGNLYIGTSTDAYATSTPAALTILNNGNVGISSTSPSQQFSIGGLAYIGGAGTSTIENNLYVMGTLRATRSYVGDLVFGNNFLFTESEPAASPQSLILKNQRGEDILSVDENGNLEIKGEIKSSNLLSASNQTSSQLLSWFLDQLQQIGITITNEYIKVKELIAEKIFTDEITSKNIKIIDKATGEIWCTWLENGEWQKAKGECTAEAPSIETTPTPETSATPEATPTPEATSVSD